MGKTAEDIEDINFILQELLRFVSMSWNELKDYLEIHKEDGLCTISHPRGDGSILFCGKEAYKRFYRLAERHLATEKTLQVNFKTEIFAGAISDAFVQFFLKENKEVNQKYVNKMFSSVLNKLKGKHKSLTHYIPCVIVSEAKPPAFNIGLVHFIAMEKFLRDNQESFELEKRAMRDDLLRRSQEAVEQGRYTADKVITPEQATENANLHVEALIEYFTKFKWVAEVTIPECDEEVSRYRAEVTVEAALKILKLFFSMHYGNTLRQGHDRGIPTKIGTLTRDVEGTLDITLSYNSEGAHAEDNWFQTIVKVHGFYLRAAGSALFALIYPERSTTLSQRFLDSLSWYGQAVTEKLPPAKIIRFAAAPERLTITEGVENQRITQAVSTRTALLGFENLDDREKAIMDAKKEAKKIYDWRSKLMHGSGSPFDRRLEEISYIAEKITRLALFRGLELFVSLEHDSNKTITNKDLEKKYRSMELGFPPDPAES